MIVGKRNVDINELVRHINTAEEFVAYTDSLVPKDFRHVVAICDNQRYLCVALLRNSTLVSWEQKKAIIDSILSNVTISGYVSEIIETDHLLSICNLSRLDSFYGGVPDGCVS